MNTAIFMEHTPMQRDTHELLGREMYLDWRWRQGVQRLAGLDSAHTPEEYFAGPDSEYLLSDKTLTDFLFHYLKSRVESERGAGLRRNRLEAIHLAVSAAQEVLITPSCYSLNLEAGLLGGRPLGELMPGIAAFPPLAQVLYEELFFDVRGLLHSPRELCRLLLRDRRRFEHRGGYDWLCKIMAYGLGFAEYLRWRSQKSLRAIEAVQSAVTNTLFYVHGLRSLRLERPEDFIEAHCRLFAALPSMNTTTNSRTDNDHNNWHDDFGQEEFDIAMTMIPIAQTSGV